MWKNTSSHKTGPSVVLFFIFVWLFCPTPGEIKLPVARDKDKKTHIFGGWNQFNFGIFVLKYNWAINWLSKYLPFIFCH